MAKAEKVKMRQFESLPADERRAEKLRIHFEERTYSAMIRKVLKYASETLGLE